MRSRSFGFFALILGMVSWLVWAAPPLSSQQRGQPTEADIVLHNGKILTVDSRFSTAEAVAIQGQKFTAVGRNADVRKLEGPKTTVIDLKGRTVIPGLIDTHAHIHNYAEDAYGSGLPPDKLHRYLIDMRAVTSVGDVLNQMRGWFDKYPFPPDQWVYFEVSVSFAGGRGTTDQARILYDELNRWELDKVSASVPVVLSLGIPDFNGFLLNSKAIDLLWNQLGYADYAKKYGRYWIDSSGQPEGHVEPPISRLVGQHVLNRDPEVLAPLFGKFLDELAASGVTTVSTRLPQEAVKAYELLKSKGEMRLRLGYGREEVFGPLKDPKNDLKAFRNIAGTGDDLFWVTSVAPTAVDGATTRACTNQKRLTPFGPIDRWWPTGQCHTDNEFRGAAGKAASISGNYFMDWTMESGRNGVRFANTHVAGDRSVSNLLNAMERLQKEQGVSATRGWALDHCVLVNPDDFKKAAQLRVWFSCASKYVEDTAPFVAQSYGEKIAHTFLVPAKSMLDAGIKVVFESDRDTYIWHDLEILLTRKDRKGNVWGPQERVDRATVLRMVTRWAADYVLKPDKLGAIEPGRLADLAVLDRDYMTIPVEQVSDIHPQLTVLDGKIIYVTPKFAEESNARPAGAVVATYEELVARRTSRRRMDF